MNNFNIEGNQGYYQDSENLISFQIGADTTPGVVDVDQFNNLNMPVLYNVGMHKILIKGIRNLLPEEIQAMVGGNRLLPELIEKQVRIQYGKGLHVYKKGVENGKPTRTWEDQKQITTWLDSWQFRGLTDSPEQFSMKIIRDFYYFEDYWIKWRFNKSRRTGGEMPVMGLEHIDNRRCRLGTKKNIILTDDPEDRDFESVIVGNWMYGNQRTFKTYNRLFPGRELASPVAVSYHKNASVGEIYGKNKYYEGIKEWLIGMNRNPRYINSFLKNSLSAKIHLIIPVEWIESVEAKLKEYCEENAKREEAGQTLLKPNGVEIGTDYNKYKG